MNVARTMILLCFGLNAFLWAKPLVAVLNVEAKTHKNLYLQALVEQELLTSNAYQVVERSQTQTIIQEQGLQSSGACTEESCNVEVGQLLGAEMIVISKVFQLPSRKYQYQLKLLDVEKGTLVSIYNYKGEVINDSEKETEFVAKNFVLNIQNKKLMNWSDQKEWHEKPLTWLAIGGAVLLGTISYWAITAEEKKENVIESEL